jgi:hypothetical protein
MDESKRNLIITHLAEKIGIVIVIILTHILPFTLFFMCWADDGTHRKKLE